MPAMSTRGGARARRRSARRRPPAGARSSAPSRRVERRERGEEAEVDAERVGVAGPRLDAVEAHPDEHHDDVDEHDARRAAPGSRAVPQHSSQMPKPAIPTAAGQRPSRAGYASGSGGVAATRPVQPAGGAADRAPRADQPPDVAEEQRRERDADPERDVDHPRREVVALGRRCPRAPRRRSRRARSTPERAEHDVGGEREPDRPPLAASAAAAAATTARRARANDSTSTAAAAAPNIASGIGRSARPTMPWAKTITADESMKRRRPRRGGAVERLRQRERQRATSCTSP